MKRYSLQTTYDAGQVAARSDLDGNEYGLVARIGSEFAGRPWLSRTLVRFCLDKTLRRRIVTLLLGGLAGVGSKPASVALTDLTYYQGLVDELGAVEVWWANTNPAVLKAYQTRPAEADPSPGISVLLGTRDRPIALKNCLECLQASPYSPFEVIIADQSDLDTTCEVVKPFLADPRFQYIRLTSRGRIRALNEVVQTARYPIIAVTDDDCRPVPDWLPALGRIFTNRPEVGLVIGQVKACEHDPATDYVPAYEFKQARYCGRRQLLKPGGYGMGANMVARREVYDQIGPLDEQLGPGAGILPASDDLDFCYRAYHAGFIHLQSPAASMWHDGIRSNADRGRLVAGYNRSATAAYTKYVRTGDLIAGHLLFSTLLSSTLYPVRQLIKRQRPLGLRGLWASLQGVRKGLAWPLDRRYGLFKPVPERMASWWSPLTLAICTRNRPQDLETAVCSLLATGYPKLEILIVDQSEKDGGQTETIFKTLADQHRDQPGLTFRYIRSATAGIGLAHNLAMEEALYPIVGFTDDDCRVAADWPFVIARYFHQHPQLGVVVGAVETGPHDSQAGFIPHFTGFRAGRAGLDCYVRPGRGGMGANFALRKSAFGATGPFDPALGSGGVLKSGSDIDFFYRAWRRGQTVFYAPDCRVWHDGFRTFTVVGGLNARSYFGIGASFVKNLRCGDPIAGVCLLGWSLITGTQALRYGLPRLIKRQRPLGVRNLLSLAQGGLAAFSLPIDRLNQVYQVDIKQIDEWSDDKSMGLAHAQTHKE